MKTPTETPLLAELADGCLNGACNTGALIRSLAKAIDEVPTFEVKTHPAVKIALGQISYLMGETIGPTTEAMQQYRDWKNAN